MKKLTILLLLIPMLSFGQESKISKYSIGDEFRLAKRHWYTGLVITTVATGFTALSANSKDDTFLVPGVVLYLIGFVFMAESWSHIGKAGRLMNSKKIGLTFNDGIGLRYRI